MIGWPRANLSSGSEGILWNRAPANGCLLTYGSVGLASVGWLEDVIGIRQGDRTNREKCVEESIQITWWPPGKSTKGDDRKGSEKFRRFSGRRRAYFKFAKSQNKIFITHQSVIKRV